MVNVPDGAATATLGELTIAIYTDEAVVEGPPGDGALAEIDGSVEAFRDMARFDRRGRYRPLAGARGLRGGWFARFRNLEALDAALDAVYPLAQRHAADLADGRLRIVPLDVVLRRQTGRYEVAATLSERGRAMASAALCGLCVKAPLWRQAGDALGTIWMPGRMPCPEPCSVMVALCREAALWERERPAPAAVDPSAPFAAFDQPGNEIRETMLVAMEAGQ